MKKNKYVRALTFGLLSWLLGFAAFMPVHYFFERIAYPALNEWFPRVFPSYNFVTDESGYLALADNIELISAFAAIFILTYITVRFDNERAEYIITATDGLYTVPQGAAVYFPRYLRPDIICALMLPVPLAVADLFIPLELPKWLAPILDTLLSLNRVFTERFGLFIGTLFMMLGVFISRVLSGLLALRSHRAAWLSDIGGSQ